jgi:hypothetical protein
MVFYSGKLVILLIIFRNPSLHFIVAAYQGIEKYNAAFYLTYFCNLASWIISQKHIIFSMYETSYPYNAISSLIPGWQFCRH